MAWSPASYSGTHQYRKEASAHGRSNENKAALIEPTPKHTRKSIPAIKRKFGIECRYIGPKRGSLSFLFGEKDSEWHIEYNCWYEKRRDRDNALAAFLKVGWRSDRYEYRAVDR